MIWLFDYCLHLGQLDTELSRTGKRQASLCGKRLQNEYFTHVYSSDLKRAKRVSPLLQIRFEH